MGNTGFIAPLHPKKKDHIKNQMDTTRLLIVIYIYTHVYMGNVGVI